MGSFVTWSLLSWDYQKSKNRQKLVNSYSRKYQAVRQNLWGSWQVVPGICQAPSYQATFSKHETIRVQHAEHVKKHFPKLPPNYKHTAKA
jgi:hypothetical protein